MDRKSVRAMLWRASILVLAAAAGLTPLPPGGIDRVYSSDLYLRWQPWLTSASNLVPFAVFDLLVLCLGAAWFGLAAVDRWRGGLAWLAVAGRAAVRTAVWAAALYVAFIVLWGLNYRRVPLADKLQFEAAGVSAAAARSLAVRAVDDLNALHDRAHAGLSNGDEAPRELPTLFARAERALGASRLAVPGRPKRSIFDLYFRRAGVAGMIDPYLLETLVASDLLPFERPFVIAHEWGHLAGYADESEANFVAWITCLQGPPAFQYSAWMALFGDIIASVPRRDRAALVAALGPGPRADIRAMRERALRNISPPVSMAGWRVYDRYLKANRVEAGTASYAAVVRLLLGVRFSDGWVPLRK